MIDWKDDECGSQAKHTLSSEDIKTNRLTGRRSFLSTLRIALFGAAAIVVGQAPPASARDFPKGSSDSDSTTNKDLKSVDSDNRNSKAVDSDQNRLRDVKRSSDSDK